MSAMLAGVTYEMTLMFNYVRFAAILLAVLGALCVLARTNRVYFVGNSVTDTERYDALRQLAESRGHVQPWGRQMIPGAPLEWL